MTITSKEMAALEAELGRLCPNWRLIYDNDLGEAARDCGLLDEQDVELEPGYEELDFSSERTLWRRLSESEEESDYDSTED